MVVNKHQVLLNILNNQPTDITLASFWHHFLADEKQQVLGYQDLKSIAEVVRLQQEFYDNAQPGFTKIMSDNFFLTPSLLGKKFNNITELAQIKPISADDPWITRQVKAIKDIVEHYHGEIGSFYNIFSPWYQVRLRFEILDNDPKKIYSFFKESPEKFKEVLTILAQDLKLLVKKLITESGIDGIYLCVQQPQDDAITLDQWRKYIKPSELELLKDAQKYSDNNILHICGFEGKKNHLNDYQDYPFKAVNWATYVEHVSLKEGKELFNGRAILGGFDNTTHGVFYKGTQAEIEAETKRLLADNGSQGLLIGADCSIPFNTIDDRIKWVSVATASKNQLYGQ
ncbi:uroporphyrinogen decarboxylase [Loigolactobacillus coryniformis]|uniref:uroporphyrinogen decarboxylase family protein n=1 Tax=Loigolactobacillus coryniformis TaxID=1610 RepID=UPI002341E235|nr:uroporphyrinogen decarboxylase family protein [Loigolactobacillus coryniformis]MDC4186106.1 uroporphyrinogen decarboxylase [Loigolactobacillus coryniformis]